MFWGYAGFIYVEYSIGLVTELILIEDLFKISVVVFNHFSTNSLSSFMDIMT